LTCTEEHWRLCRFLDSGGKPERCFGPADARTLKTASAFERDATHAVVERGLVADYLDRQFCRFLSWRVIPAITNRHTIFRDQLIFRSARRLSMKLRQPPTSEPQPTTTTAPTPSPLPLTVNDDPRAVDYEAWSAAVEAAGVNIPLPVDQQRGHAAGCGYFETTHYELLCVERQGRVCEVCDDRPAATLHHTNYRRLGNERPEDLMDVCWSCHDRLHGIAPRVDAELRRLFERVDEKV
jgi:hypothetical protein